MHLNIFCDIKRFALFDDFLREVPYHSPTSKCYNYWRLREKEIKRDYQRITFIYYP